jgi:hypothetical protein
VTLLVVALVVLYEFSKEEEFSSFGYAFIGLGIVFNPVFPVSFDVNVWFFFNLLALILFSVYGMSNDEIKLKASLMKIIELIKD